MHGYRIDRRKFIAGDVVRPRGEYCRELKENDPNRYQVEVQLAQHSPGPDRCALLHLFESELDARRHWYKWDDSCLYEVSFADGDLLHRGDMQLTEIIQAKLRSGAPATEDLVAYWNGPTARSACVELLVDHATVTRVISCDERERRAWALRQIGYADFDPHAPVD